MSSNGTRRLEAWLVLAAMLSSMTWYARPQLVYSIMALRELAHLALGALGG
jgi:hypothetical protein